MVLALLVFDRRVVFSVLGGVIESGLVVVTNSGGRRRVGAFTISVAHGTVITLSALVYDYLGSPEYVALTVDAVAHRITVAASVAGAAATYRAKRGVHRGAGWARIKAVQPLAVLDLGQESRRWLAHVVPATGAVEIDLNSIACLSGLPPRARSVAVSLSRNNTLDLSTFAFELLGRPEYLRLVTDHTARTLALSASRKPSAFKVMRTTTGAARIEVPGLAESLGYTDSHSRRWDAVYDDRRGVLGVDLANVPVVMNRPSSRPSTVSISTGGTLGLNAPAFQTLGEPDWVRVSISGSEVTISAIAAAARSGGEYRPQRGSFGGARINAVALIHQHQIDTSVRRTWTVQPSSLPATLKIDLSSTSTAVSPRAGNGKLGVSVVGNRIAITKALTELLGRPAAVHLQISENSRRVTFAAANRHAALDAAPGSRSNLRISPSGTSELTTAALIERLAIDTTTRQRWHADVDPGARVFIVDFNEPPLR